MGYGAGFVKVGNALLLLLIAILVIMGGTVVSGAITTTFEKAAQRFERRQ